MEESRMGNSRFEDERADLHPRSWLRPFRRKSIRYMTEMLLFYHGLGIGLLIGGTALVQLVIPSHEEPSIERSLISVLAAGPIEETVFFGIPFYVIGNTYSVLATGAIWAGIHVLNTPTLEVASLSFGNLFFVIPSLFFSLRTWATGRGWFSVLVHSAWNGIFFGAGCATGEFPCTTLGTGLDEALSWILLSAALLGGTYILYRKRENRERQRLKA